MRAALECSLYYDAEALMVFYGFIAGWGALNAARVDYFKASCWLWNVKCLDHPHYQLQESSGCPSICLLQEMDHVEEYATTTKKTPMSVYNDQHAAAPKNYRCNSVCTK